MKKKIFSIWSVLLILIVSIAVVVPGCDGGDTYALTMAENPASGGTATDLTGTSPYAAETAVNISAVAASCYQFTGWTSSAGGTFGDANAAVTNFTMPRQDVTVTANFELTPPDHYKLYDVDSETAPSPDKEVELEDQFGTFEAVVGDAVLFGNPVEKEHPGMPLTLIADENRHYTLYDLEYNYEEDSVYRSVEVSNQFEDKVELTVWGPVMLAVPTQKLVPGDHEMVECLNHYLVYLVDETEFDPVESVNLKDQFIPDGEDVTVWGPYYFANPVKKTVVENGDVAVIEDENLHWVLYDIEDTGFDESIDETIQIANQFGDDQILDLTYRDVLAVPSEKNVPPTPPLDHFKCYPAEGPGLVEVYTYLEDQFGSYESVPVFAPWLFCNPVDKVHAGGPTTNRNDDNHLTVYNIVTEPYWWTVTVDNQFNDAAVPQTLLVTGPIALAVPTQKLEPYYHEKPKYLDHYLLYAVVEGLNVTATVDLDDQFPGAAPGVTVTEPVYFATPAIKGYLDYEPGFWDPEGHLVFYAISDNDEYVPAVLINNQFQEATLVLDDFNELLAVPSVKVYWEPFIT